MKYFTPWVMIVVSGGIAHAQPAAVGTVTNIHLRPPAPPTTTEPEWFERLGFAISAGGGVEGFTDDAMRDTSSVGGNWDVRFTLGTRYRVAFETSYIGSAQSIDALGLDPSALLVGNGLQSALRLNVLPHLAINPFVYGGAAWRHYRLRDVDFNTSDIKHRDDVFEIPVGVGVDYKFSGLIVDGRAEFRPATGADLIPDRFGSRTTVELHRWGVNINIGYEF